MEKNAYLSEILVTMGLAINLENNIEIIVNYPIKYDEKNMKFTIDSEYKVSSQTLGTFLIEFLNIDFEIYDEFFSFFMKYSLALLNYKKIQKFFDNSICSSEVFNEFVSNLYLKNKKVCQKLQEETDIVLNYCFLNPNKQATNYTPLERLYVLRRIAAHLTILNEHKASYYSTNLFKDFPGNSEKQIYSFLYSQKNPVVEYDLIIPFDIASIIYKSLNNIFKGTVYLKICKNCGKYFIATNKSSDYCDNIAPSEIKKTCKDIGRKKVFETSKESDPILSYYYKIYNRKSMLKSRNKDISIYADDFNKFKDIGKKKLVLYKDGKISAHDFKNWIDKYS